MDYWFFFIVILALNQWEDVLGLPQISPSDSTFQQLCHTALVRGMGKICEQYYNNAERVTTQQRVKRSEVVIGGDGSQWEEGERFIPRRIPRNVVQECCRRPCNTATLRQYCSRVRGTRRSVSDSEAAMANESQDTTDSLNPEEIIFEATKGRSTTPISITAQLQSVTQSPYPEPIPIGEDFNEIQFYG